MQLQFLWPTLSIGTDVLHYKLVVMKSVNYSMRHIYSGVTLERFQSNVLSTSRLHHRPDEPRGRNLQCKFADKKYSPEVSIIHSLPAI